MPRQLKPLEYEDNGFSSMEAAIEFCKNRPAITQAKIVRRLNFHVIVSAYEHHLQFYYHVADYTRIPNVVYIPLESQ